MSYEDQGEATEREMWSVIFRATAAQCREIVRRKNAHPKYRRWCVVDYLVKCGKFDAFEPKAVALCEELTDLDAVMCQSVRAIVADVTGADG